ncbi:MAG: SPOR domain-containing protein [Leptospiraceae bacterium]|nr:SPOR domain-containing protein [Leptospiraceae bacterium]
MQNIDYAKKIKHKQRLERQEPIPYSRPRPEKSSAIKEFLSTQNREIPLFHLFLGGVLFFTSGLFVGQKLERKEASFEMNEVKSFSNAAPTEAKEKQVSETENKEGDFEESSANSKEKPIKPSHASLPKEFQYPPKSNQINYIIQLGNFSKEDAMKLAASLLKEKQEFQGRIFRTSTGKLYLGYYYDEKEARLVLKKVRKFQNGVFAEAGLKNIQF